MKNSVISPAIGPSACLFAFFALTGSPAQAAAAARADCTTSAPRITFKRVAMAGFLALSSLVLGGTQAVADLPLIIPQMTINIYNNSGDYNSYSVISFPGGPLNAIDKWMQAFFGTTWANQNTQTYRNGLGTTRVYVNCCDSGQTGIPPGGKVEIRLPLYTPLVHGDSAT